MTEILCKWLNDEVTLEPKLVVADSSFAEKFSNGYLIGEILCKHNIQSDFKSFSKGSSSDAKLNNFTRLEPTLKLLGIPFNANIARDLMTQKPGVATRLMYQVFIALNRKAENQYTTQLLECMKSPGRLNLERVETDIFQERLKHQTPRQVDLNFEELIEKFQERKKVFEEKMVQQMKEDDQKSFLDKMEHCHKSLEQSRITRERQSILYKKLKPLSPSKGVFRARSSPGIHSATFRHAAPLRKKIADETQRSIDQFELSLKKRSTLPSVGPLMLHHPPGSPSITAKPSTSPDTTAKSTSTDAVTFMTSSSSMDYLKVIHTRVAGETQARGEREKRRRKILMDQMKALNEQEESKREKMLVERLMRQCQQERRIATQLMHIRKEKDTIRNNRILRQQQHMEQKEQEFQEALNREAGLALLEEKERKERLKHHKILYHNNLKEKAERNYRVNYSVCEVVMLQMLDFATKLAHYRELTNNLVPAKIVRDWKVLFIAGKPLYDEDDTGPKNALSSVVTGISDNTTGTQYNNMENSKILNDYDFQEYKDAVSEWAPGDSMSVSDPPPPPYPASPILSHIVYTLLDMVDPPQMAPSPPHMPRFLIRASIIGKPFTGKTTALHRLGNVYGVAVLSIESIISEAINTYHMERNRQSPFSSQQEEMSQIFSDNEVVKSTSQVDPCSSMDIMMSPNEAPTAVVEKRGRGPPVVVVAGNSVGGGTPMVGGTPVVGGTPETPVVAGGAQVAPAVGGAPVLEEEEEGNVVELSEEQISQLSPLARLGYKAHRTMILEEALDDDSLVEIFVHKIQSLHEGSGWILDNFPATSTQAKLLSAALSVPPPPKPTLSRDFTLLAELDDNNENLLSASGLDVVLHFTASTEVVLDRASKQDESQQGSNKLEQIQGRLLAHAENWPSLRRWYSKFRIVSNINANMDLESMCDLASKKILEGINKNKQANAMKKLGLVGGLNSGSVTSLSSMTSSPTKSRTKKPRASKGISPRPSSAESPSPARAGKKRVKKGTQISRKTPESPLRQATKAQATKETAGLAVKNEWTPLNMDVSPGEPGWVYYTRQLTNELAHGLALKWPEIEKTYISTFKQIFQMLREEREAFCNYFFLRRKEFSSYLVRPDHKQEFISQWQTIYNHVESQLRCEDMMKAELHHRVDDLTDKLWDICERRKLQGKEEQTRIKEEQWLEDHIGLLSNHYISIMQTELDRFHDTILLMKDYYIDKIPEKLAELTRMTLIELAPTEPQDAPASQAGSTHSISQKSSSNKCLTDHEGGENTSSLGKEIVKRRIPLMPRLAAHPPGEVVEDKGGLGGGKKRNSAVTAGTAGAVGAASATPISGHTDTSGVDLDLKLITNSYSSAAASVITAMTADVKAVDAILVEMNKPKPLEVPPPEPRDEKGAKGKKGKSPVSKKGSKKAAAPPEPVPEIKPPVMSPEEVMKKQQTTQMCKEYKAALHHEEMRIKGRLELIKMKCITHIEMLKSTSEVMHQEMTDWINNCYEQEIQSVNYLSDVLREAIENEKKLLYEITLPGAKFQIRESVITFVPTPPSSTPQPLEHPDTSYFTVTQLHFLHQQLVSIAPSGFLPVKILVETLTELINKSSSKGHILPQLWENASKQQVDYMMELLCGHDVEFVDWRKFFLCTALPWPLPSPEDIVEAWNTLATPDGTLEKKEVTKEQFMSAQIWLDREEGREEEDVAFDRNHELKEVIFDVFCDIESGDLDVWQLLLYLCADPNPKTGLFKAFSLATNTPIHSHQDVDAHLTILLQDFHSIMTLGSYPDSDTNTIALSELLDVFAQVDPHNPNEVSLAILLCHPTATNILQSCMNYFLPDLSSSLMPVVTAP